MPITHHKSHAFIHTFYTYIPFCITHLYVLLTHTYTLAYIYIAIQSLMFITSYCLDAQYF